MCRPSAPGTDARAVEGLRDKNERKLRRRCENQRSVHAHQNPDSGETPFPRYCVSDSSAGVLSNYASNLASCERQANALLGPSQTCQIKSDECAQASLYTGYHEVQAVQRIPALTGCGGTHPLPGIAVARSQRRMGTYPTNAHQLDQRKREIPGAQIVTPSARDAKLMVPWSPGKVRLNRIQCRA
jgi:hypothetical protein